MANNLVLAEASRLVDASVATAAYTAPTAPIKGRLMATTGTNATPGTEVTGGSYTPQNFTFSAAASGVAANSGTVTYTGMPATTVNGIELWDSAGTPRRQWTGALTTPKTVGAGDSLTFAPSSVQISAV